MTKSNESKENSTTAILSPNSLLSFNLEPLTDTLETLELSDNGFSGLPMQFQGRSFARLRDLDLSHNPIKGERAYILKSKLALVCCHALHEISSFFKRHTLISYEKGNYFMGF